MYSGWLLREILQESFSLVHFPKKQHLHGHQITIEDEETLLASHLTLPSQLVAMLLVPHNPKLVFWCSTPHFHMNMFAPHSVKHTIRILNMVPLVSYFNSHEQVLKIGHYPSLNWDIRVHKLLRIGNLTITLQNLQSKFNSN